MILESSVAISLRAVVAHVDHVSRVAVVDLHSSRLVQFGVPRDAVRIHVVWLVNCSGLADAPRRRSHHWGSRSILRRIVGLGALILELLHLVKLGVRVVEVLLLLRRLVKYVVVLVNMQVCVEVTLFRAKHRD